MAAARTREIEAPPRYDAYFGLLVLSTIGLFTGLLFAYLDYSGYNPAPKALTKTTAGAIEQPAVGMGQKGK